MLQLELLAVGAEAVASVSGQLLVADWAVKPHTLCYRAQQWRSEPHTPVALRAEELAAVSEAHLKLDW